MTTHDIIEVVTRYIEPIDLIVSSLGRTAEETFLQVENTERILFLDCMGAVTGVAIGVSLGCPHTHVFAFDTDGSLMYDLSIFHTLANQIDSIKNLRILIFDNELLESGGGLKTRLTPFDWVRFAASWKVKVYVAHQIEELENILKTKKEVLTIIVLKVDNNNILQTCHKDLDGIESKYRFKRFINNNINPGIIKPAIKN